MSDILEQGLAAQAKSLREFGYPDVTTEMVRSAHAKWMSGDELSNVVEMFCGRAFDEYPQIFGQPDKSA